MLLGGLGCGLTSRFLVRCAIIIGALLFIPGLFDEIERRFLLRLQGDEVIALCLPCPPRTG